MGGELDQRLYAHAGEELERLCAIRNEIETKKSHAAFRNRLVGATRTEEQIGACPVSLVPFDDFTANDEDALTHFVV